MTPVGLLGEGSRGDGTAARASRLLPGGADLFEVHSVLGHKTIHMTLRYAQLSRAKTARKMGALLNKALNGVSAWPTFRTTP